MNLAQMLEAEEDRVPHAYQDHLGYWTIGKRVDEIRKEIWKLEHPK
jgi:tetrahydromethanopterin S-methyltransferase subunit G